MSNYNFATVPKAGIQRSSFDRSHNWKGTFDAGKLIPFFVDEVLPGDTFNLNVSMLCRMATPIVPIMDNLYLDTFFFFVPNRLVWNNWQKFMGEREDPDDSIDYIVPYLINGDNLFGVVSNSALDYMGIPVGNFYGKNAVHINSLPLRAYCLIWNEWFRDENLQDSIKINKSDSGFYTSDNSSLPEGLLNSANSCFPRGKRHDYFTSALPWPQKGDAVDLPLGTTSPVYYSTTYGDGTLAARAPVANSYSLGDAGVMSGTVHAAGMDYGTIENETHLYADLTQATAATINSLRAAFQVQRLLENDARGGKLSCLHFKKIEEKIWKAA